MSVAAISAALAFKAKKFGVIGILPLSVGAVEMNAIEAAYPYCDGNGHKMVMIDTDQPTILDLCDERKTHFVDLNEKDMTCAPNTAQAKIQQDDVKATKMGLSHHFCFLSTDVWQRQADHDRQNLYVSKSSPNYGHTLNYSFTM